MCILHCIYVHLTQLSDHFLSLLVCSVALHWWCWPKWVTPTSTQSRSSWTTFSSMPWVSPGTLPWINRTLSRCIHTYIHTYVRAWCPYKDAGIGGGRGKGDNIPHFIVLIIIQRKHLSAHFLYIHQFYVTMFIVMTIYLYCCLFVYSYWSMHKLWHQSSALRLVVSFKASTVPVGECGRPVSMGRTCL